jgi:hypothetical protein
LVERLVDEVEERVDVLQEDTSDIVQTGGELIGLENVGTVAGLREYELIPTSWEDIENTHEVSEDGLIDDPVAVSVVSTRKNGMSLSDLHSKTSDISHSSG